MNIRQIMTSEKGLSRTDIVAAICLACNMVPEQVYSRLDREIGDEDMQSLRRYLDERTAGRPMSYITGTREFFSERFFVNEDVLIPRPDTEVLVEEAIRLIDGRKGLKVLDMGTGSGAIGIMIAKHTENDVLCVDISEAALRVARKNASLIGVVKRTRFVCSDLFDALQADTRFDVIAANLPYIESGELASLMADVRDYEPMGALDGGPDGNDHYRRFIDRLPGYTAPGGHVLLEIGSTRQAIEVGDMLRSAGLGVTCKRDYSGRDRVITGHG